MTRQEESAVKLFVELNHWLGFRDGYSAWQLDHDMNQWAKSNTATNEIERLMGFVDGSPAGYDLWKYPADLFRAVVCIWKITRELPSERAAYRALRISAYRDNNRLARLAFDVIS